MTGIDMNLPKEQRILLAAEEVFSRRGYVQATLDEIITLADTGKGTLYKHYGNKDNLFYTLIATKNAPFIEKLQAIETSDLDIPTKLRRYIAELFIFLRENKGLWQMLWYEISSRHLGIHPMLDRDGQWQLVSNYGASVTEEDKQRFSRFHLIILNEILVLIHILQQGVATDFLKSTDKDLTYTKKNTPVNKDDEANYGAYHLFGSVATSVFHFVGDAEIDPELFAKLVVDRFLYGHAIR